MDRVYELAPGAKAQLHALVKTRLIETSEYNDDVLPEYIVVMVGNRKSCAHLCEDLEAFLGKEGATAFSLWLWDTLSRSPLVVASPDLAKPKDTFLQTILAEHGNVVGNTEPITQAHPETSETRNLKLSSPERNTLSSTVGYVSRSRDRQRSSVSVSGGPARLVRAATESAAKSTRSQRSPNRSVQRVRQSLPTLTPPTTMQASVEENNTTGKHEQNLQLDQQKTERRVVASPPSPERKVVFTVTLNGVGQLPSVTQPTQKSEEPSRKRKIDTSRTRCAYWPSCAQGSACEYFHPTEACKHFPACTRGNSCLYIHPVLPCKFGFHCARPNCQYTHPSGRPILLNNSSPFEPPVKKQTIATPCRNGFACPMQPTCKFSHPKIFLLQPQVCTILTHISFSLPSTFTKGSL
eukprot:TRINITY_DN3703_c0_g1_i2.p1 TRINITY_DN3703_c0_g1~~TRINITY_DN3703_c0_g1_i2.p1  ORF type:complete len:408 (+),score=22.53 TRINITY_DN3703_c0_g1_i2:62-1285(+)